MSEDTGIYDSMERMLGEREGSDYWIVVDSVTGERKNLLETKEISCTKQIQENEGETLHSKAGAILPPNTVAKHKEVAKNEMTVNKDGKLKQQTTGAICNWTEKI